ncbi:putative polyketide synthase [Xylaria flabelliformis]|nr:putative polyketide synthase [Xylaria flabelliformis]
MFPCLIFNAGSVLHELEGDHKYEYVEGTLPAPQAAGIEMRLIANFKEIEDFFPSNDSYVQYYDMLSLESTSTAITQLQRYIEEEGPFDGIIGYSQGATLAATYLIRFAQLHPTTPLPFECAIFFSGGHPVNPLLLDKGELRLLERQEDLSPPISLPTACIWGRNDTLWPGSSETLWRLCDPATSMSFIHDEGHDIPGSRARGAVMGAVGIIRPLAQNLGIAWLYKPWLKNYHPSTRDMQYMRYRAKPNMPIEKDERLMHEALLHLIYCSPSPRMPQNAYMDMDYLEPIAIVGISFGFPGEANTTQSFWDLLMSKRNASSEFPKDRLNIDGLYHPDPNRRGQIPVRGGHFIENVDAFDASFFSVAEDDAAVIDPQQRGLLEHTYKALENGCFGIDYTHLTFKDTEQAGTTMALGLQPCINANRISWFYNLKGNSANIDTACSSSLVALDMGVAGLRRGDGDMAFNRGRLQSKSYSFDHRANGYARGEGFGVLVLKRLKDALQHGDTIRAVIRSTGTNQDGHTPGMTTPSSKAQESLIRDTYEKAGLSMKPTRYFEAHGTGTPVGDPLEAAAIGAAFRKTRTPEDPLIVGALKSNVGHLEGAAGIAGVIKAVLVLEKGIIPPNANFEKTNPRIDAEFLRIEFPQKPVPWPANGLRRASVNSFGFGGTNAHVVIDDAYHFLHDHSMTGSHITVAKPPEHLVFGKSQDSHPGSSPISKQVNGFGPHSAQPRLLFLSAHDKQGTARQATQLSSMFAGQTNDHIQNYHLEDLEFTLNFRRSLLSWNSFAVVDSLDDVRDLEKRLNPPIRRLTNPSLGFIFTGQGAQWAQMGQSLLCFPAFNSSLEMAEEFLATIGCQWRLREEMFKPAAESIINTAEISQPLCTALQVALIDLLETLGVRPTVVIGHSSGEIAAAYAAGALSASDAWMIAYYRGICAAELAMKRNVRKGSMMAVGLSQQATLLHIADVTKSFAHQGLTVACINSPTNVTVSGDAEQIEALRVRLDVKRVFARKLVVDVAYHSPRMEAVAQQYKSLISDVTRQDGNGKRNSIMVSSVTGERIMPDALTCPDYWVANMVSPVRFADAVSCLFSNRARRVRKRLDLKHRQHFHIDALIEIGPHPALRGPVRDILADLPGMADIHYSSVLLRNEATLNPILTALGQVRCLGYAVDLKKLNYRDRQTASQVMVLPDLPSYPFDHSKRHWRESRLSKRYRLSPQGKLDLLGKPVPDWNPLEAKWRNILRVSEMPWMDDHVINGTLVYPGAGLLIMAIEAAKQLADTSRVLHGFELKDCSFEQALRIPRTADGIEVQTSLVAQPTKTDASRTWSMFRICAYENDQWLECCHGLVRVEYEPVANDVDGGREWHEELSTAQQKHDTLTEACGSAFDAAKLYETLNKSGFGFGPSFQRITSGHFSEDGKKTQGKLELFKWPSEQHPQEHVVHPTSLDGFLHLGTGAIARGGQEVMATTIPSLVRSIWVSSKGLSWSENASHVEGSAWVVSEDNRGFEVDGVVLDAQKSALLARIHGLKLTIVSDANHQASASLGPDKHICYNVEYHPVPDILNQTGNKLIEFMARLGNQKPGLSILQLGSGEDSCATIARDILQSLTLASEKGERAEPLFDSFVLALQFGESLNKLQEILGKFPSTSLVETEISRLEFDTNSFDIVVYTRKFLDDAEEATPKLFQSLHSLLKPAGYLVSVGRTGAGDIDLRPEPLPRHLFSKVLVTHGLQIHKKESGEPPKTSNQSSLILVIDGTSNLQNEMAEKIKIFPQAAVFGSVRTVTLEEAISIPTSEDTVFLVLLELEHPVLYNIEENGYYEMQKFLIAHSDIVWVNIYGGQQPGRPEYAVLNGWARVIRNEYPEHRLSTIQIEIKDEIRDGQISWIYEVLTNNHLNNTANVHHEWEYVEMGNELRVPRLIANKQLTNDVHNRSLAQQSSQVRVGDAPPLLLTIGTPGLLDTLHFVRDYTLDAPLRDDEVEVCAHAVGMNFKDCLIALGQVSGKSLGLECAGVITRAGKMVTNIKPGDRVLVGAPIATVVRARESEIYKIPESMSFTDAASIPTQFGTAWEVLSERAKLRKGETILIHAAAGGTGQAAVQIAHYIGATVYATVGSTEKKQLLMETYGIPEDRIFYSRNTDFAKGVMRMTAGRGVDVVINSLSGESLVASWGLVADHGRFVEIGKADIAGNSNLPMLPFLRNVSFIGFDLTAWQRDKPADARRSMQHVIDMFANKTFQTVQPLHVYDISMVEDVFRSMQSGRVIGKMVMQMRSESAVKATLATEPSFMLDPKATYVIAGGLGGAGRNIARWMVRRNARNLILLSRSGPRTDEARELLNELSHQGVRVEAPPCDITDKMAVAAVFKSLVDMPPIRGCIQGTMARENILFDNLSYESYSAGAGTKAQGSWNLHMVLPRGMDFFVLLASASGLVGLRSQLSYNAGNTYEDAFARWRVSCGEKAVSLDLGGLVDDGVLAEKPDLMQRVLGYGIVGLVTRSQFDAILDYFCDPNRPLGCPRESQAVIGISTDQGSGLDRVDTRDDPLFSHVHYHARRNAAGGVSTEAHTNYRQLIATATSLGDAAAHMTDALIDKLAVSLASLSRDAVDVHKPLHTFGVDSLLAVELRNWIGREVSADVAIFEILGSATFATLGTLIAKRSKINHEAWLD